MARCTVVRSHGLKIFLQSSTTWLPRPRGKITADIHPRSDAASHLQQLDTQSRTNSSVSGRLGGSENLETTWMHMHWAEIGVVTCV